MKKLVALFITFILLLTSVLSGCNQASSGNGSESSSPLPNQPTESSSKDQEPAPEPSVNNFEIYQSNSITPSGNNYMLKSENGGKVTNTFRGLFKIQEFGELEYKFYFSNNVDSTYSNGSYSYRNMPTKPYKIISAKVGTLPMSGMGAISDPKTITFDGSESREVKASEKYWSDAVTLNVESNEYLAFEWTVEYVNIPATLAENVVSIFDYSSGKMALTSAAPLPDMIGCKRENAVRIGFIGDSITMGVGSGGRNHKFWAAQVTEALGADVSAWNLGLGYARANDMINSPAWLEKAKQNDIVIICFGVNDINSGGYEVGTRTAEQIKIDIGKIAKACTDAGAKVIIFTTPPYAYRSGGVSVWANLVKQLKTLANDKGYGLFDFAAVLGDPDDPSKYIYGDHPNQAGCTAVANAFIESGIINSLIDELS